MLLKKSFQNFIFAKKETKSLSELDPLFVAFVRIFINFFILKVISTLMKYKTTQLGYFMTKILM